MGIRTLLVGCDNAYYEQWAVPLLKSVNYFAPWLELHAHIVNPDDYTQLDYVNYTTGYCNFTSEDSRIGYLQAVRFTVAEQFESVIIVDADTICTQAFFPEEYDQVVQGQTILHHPKADRWLAGFVASNNKQFFKDYNNRLHQAGVEDWKFGRDQDVLAELEKDYNYTPASLRWMKLGKPNKESVFLTLKGNQKTSGKYLHHYNQFVK